MTSVGILTLVPSEMEHVVPLAQPGGITLYSEIQLCCTNEPNFVAYQMLATPMKVCKQLIH